MGFYIGETKVGNIGNTFNADKVIDAYDTYISGAYKAVESKGGTIPSEKTLDNLSSSIDSIEVERYGVTLDNTVMKPNANGIVNVPSKKYKITFNGVKQFSSCSITYRWATATANIGNGLTAIEFPDLVKADYFSMYSAFSNNKDLTSAISFPQLTCVRSSNALGSTFSACLQLKSVTFDVLSTLDGANNSEGGPIRNTFQYCYALSSLEFPELREIINGKTHLYYMCRYCKALSSFTLPKLQKVIGNQVFQYSFGDCASLTSFNVPELALLSGGTQMFYYTFYNSPKLSSLSFPKLNTVYASTTAATAHFQYNNYLKDIYFQSLSAIHNNYLFNNQASLSGLHFAAKYQNEITSSVGYSTLWGLGAGKATVFFDQ